MNFTEYTASNYDTLIGIACKFNMTVPYLCKLNQISETSLVYSGMHLKVTTDNLSDIKPPKLLSPPEDSLSPKLSKVLKHEASYLTDDFESPGLLTVTENLILFDRVLGRVASSDSLASETTLDPGVQASIDMTDVLKAKVKQVPGYCLDQGRKGLAVVLILTLSCVEGNCRAKERIPRARAFFRLAGVNNTGSPHSFKELLKATQEFSEFINAHLKPKYEAKTSTVTYVPFYELTSSFSNYLQDESSCLDKESLALVKNASDIGYFLEDFEDSVENFSEKVDSKVLSPNMINLLKAEVPEYLKHRSWDLCFSPMVHGSSFKVFCRNTSEIKEHILVIQDNNYQVFGAFVTEGWKAQRQYYGSGESFLYSFKSGNLECYHATLQNSYFQIADSDHIAMGAGGIPGLYLNKDLVSGYSGSCSTYSNPSLSISEDFLVLNLEVWALT